MTMTRFRLIAAASLLWCGGVLAQGMGAGGGSGGGGGFGFGGGSDSSFGSGGMGTDHGGYSSSNPPSDLTSAIDNTWMCVRWMVVGVCYPSDLMVVTHYYPVAYITTPAKPDDGGNYSGSGSGSGSSGGSSNSAGSGGGSGGSGTGTGAGSGSGLGGGSLQTRYKDDTMNRSMAWEAIVWQITEDERDDALESWDGCLCDYSDGASMSSSNEESSGTCDSYSDSDSGGGGAGGGGSGSGSSSGGGSSSSGGGSGGGSDDREMYYSSTRDGNNWREGCRDLTSSSQGGSGPSPGGSSSGSMGGMGGDRSYDLQACQSTMGASGPSLSSQTLNENCLGAWGALYPRYTFTSGTTELISSMKIAYRAAHVASNALGKFPHPVDKMGIMQAVDPRKTFCFDIGTSPMLVDTLASASQNGQYSWIFWRKFGCCKDISSCGGGG